MQAMGAVPHKKEQMRCNGMNPTLFNIAVSEPELGKQIGDSMSQNVRERILYSLVPAAGLVDEMHRTGGKTEKLWRH